MPAEQNVGFYVLISLFLSIYSIYTLGMAVWGYKIIPSTCDNSAIRSSLRGLMVTSAVALTAYLAYAACKYLCPSAVKIKGVDVPNWLLSFTGLIGVINLVNQITIQTKFGQDPNCQTQSLETFKGWNSIGIIISTCVIGLCIIIVIIRLGDARRIALKKKRQKLKNKDEVEEEPEEAEEEEEEEEKEEKPKPAAKKSPSKPAAGAKKSPSKPAKKAAAKPPPPEEDEDPFAEPEEEKSEESDASNASPDSYWPYESAEEAEKAEEKAEKARQQLI